MGLNINLEMLGTAVSMSVTKALDALAEDLTSEDSTPESRIKTAEQINRISDNIAKWDLVSDTISGQQDDRRKALDKLDRLGNN